jgi:hypothetical protein
MDHWIQTKQVVIGWLGRWQPPHARASVRQSYFYATNTREARLHRKRYHLLVVMAGMVEQHLRNAYAYQASKPNDSYDYLSIRLQIRSPRLTYPWHRYLHDSVVGVWDRLGRALR